VDEGTWLDITSSRDVEVAPAAGDTAFGILAIIPEIHGEKRFGRPDFIDTLKHQGSLLGSSQEISSSLLADRDIGKIPGIAAAALNHIVDKLIRNDVFSIEVVITG